MPRSLCRRVARCIHRAVVLAIILSMMTSLSAIASGSGGPASGFSLPVSAGWNLICLPVDVPVATKDSIFPTAISNAFLFDNGYVPAETLIRGVGFWLKFASAETVEVAGTTLGGDTIDVVAGWNLIGGLTDPVPINTIATSPPGAVKSNYFRFISGSGYVTSDTLWPGEGYWVNLSAEGALILNPILSGCPASVVYAEKTYGTVQIGDQCWMSENLNVGTMIFRSLNATDNSTIEKYCVNNDPAVCDTFGGLYQWHEAMQYDTVSGGRGICPPSWHIPTYAELYALRTFTGNSGNALKAVGQGYGDGEGTNTTGFSALLGGYRNTDTDFYFFRANGYFWTSSQYDATTSSAMILYDYAMNINYSVHNRGNGFSVRCLKD